MEVLEMMWLMFKIALVFVFGALLCRIALGGLKWLLEWDWSNR